MAAELWDELYNTAASETSFEPVPAGDHDFVISEATCTRASTGKKMYKIKCAVESGPSAKQVVFTNLVISPDNPAALGMFFRKMAALGLGGDFFRARPTDAQVEAALLGRRFRGTVEHRQYQGSPRADIKSINPAQGAVPAGAGINPTAMPPGFQGMTPPTAAPAAPVQAAPVAAPPQPVAAPAPAPVAAAPAPVVAQPPVAAPPQPVAAPVPAAPAPQPEAAPVPQPAQFEAPPQPPF